MLTSSQARAVINIRWARKPGISAIGGARFPRFEHRSEARTFLGEPKAKWASSMVHSDKTRLIGFGIHAAKQREKLGEGKPETFTHFCTQSRLRHRRQDDQEAYASRATGPIELRWTMHDPIAKTSAWING
jgi:RNA-directed DNA polymerase